MSPRGELADRAAARGWCLSETGHFTRDARSDSRVAVGWDSGDGEMPTLRAQHSGLRSRVSPPSPGQAGCSGH